MKRLFTKINLIGMVFWAIVFAVTMLVSAPASASQNDTYETIEFVDTVFSQKVDTAYLVKNKTSQNGEIFSLECSDFDDTDRLNHRGSLSLTYASNEPLGRMRDNLEVFVQVDNFMVHKLSSRFHMSDVMVKMFLNDQILIDEIGKGDSIKLYIFKNGTEIKRTTFELNEYGKVALGLRDRCFNK